ncbi:MAG TPA: fumarylacetoacetate hydrolase family protein [Solirubrobacteraceae bacterium]|nr:fumarylacetoacetate hydrolase family protein [Solirubrobacteraceae bacterium]
MRFASVQSGDRRFAALVEGDRLVPLRGITELGAATDIGILGDPPLEPSGAIALEEALLRPVIPRPAKIICLGLNYVDHAAEASRGLPDYPVLFTKFPDCLVGPFDAVVKPPESDAMDYEVELALIIGRSVRRADAQEGAAAIAGVTVANDITMRDFQHRTHQWLQGKSWPSSTPVGPYLVTLDELDLSAGLDLALWLNGVEMQRASTRDMLFDPGAIIARISEFTPLSPGDLILTGTPAGVGHFREPPVHLKPGDRLRAEISGVGALENVVVAEQLTGSMADEAADGPR